MSLYDSLLERLEGRPYNGYFSAHCQFHDDSNPSMLVYEDGYRCSACGAHGSLKYLDRKIGTHFSPKVTRYQSSNVLPRWRTWGDSLEEIAETCHKSLKKFSQFQTYFKNRKIDEFIEKGNFGYRDGWCVLPVMDSKRSVVDIVVRQTNQHIRDTRYVLLGNGLSSHSFLYSPDWDRVQKASIVYCVFGMMDAWSLEALELPVITGITGQSIPVELLIALNKRIVIVPDDGEERSAHKIANAIGWKARVKELSYPEGTKDPDDIRVQYGKTALLNLIGA